MHCEYARAGSVLAGDLGPGIAQANRAIEHQSPRVRVLIWAEIALPFELHDIVGIERRQRGLDAGIVEDFERLRIEFGCKVAGIRIGK